MYQDYFGLHDRPFANYPGRQFYETNNTARLRGNIQRIATARDGVAVITGGPGVGKSALVENAVYPLSDRIAVARADMREVAPEELYRVLLASLDEPMVKGGPEQQLISLQEVIRQYHKNDMQVTALIDINRLDPETVAPISRLVYFAGAPDGQLNIILQGPHTLHRFLDLPVLMHLRQRVSFRYCVRPFNYADTDAYIHHQLRLVGADTQKILSADLSAVVFQYVAGVPRLINTMMDAVLGELYTANLDQATAEIAEKVAQHLGWRPLIDKPTVALKSRDTSQDDPQVAEMVPANGVAESQIDTREASDAQRDEEVVPALSHENQPGEKGYSGIPLMDGSDLGATGMLRLEEIDEHFAETIFTDDPDFFKPLIENPAGEEFNSDDSRN